MPFDPFTDAAIDDPYAGYAALRRDDPVHWSEKLRAWVVVRHDDVAALLRDDERLSADHTRSARFRRHERVPPGLRTVSSDPPAHTPVRAILTACLGPRVRAIAPRVDALVAAQLERLAAVARRDGEVDLVEEFAYPLPITVIAELLGVPEADRPRFRDWSRAIARGMDRFYAGGEAGAGLREIGAWVLGLLGERRAAPGDDLISALLVAEHLGERLSDLEVVALCTALVFGGHETTVNLIANGTLALLADREQQERLRAGPALVPPAVEELLRFDSPAQLVARTARADLTLRGRTIACGDSVLLAIGAANRDADAFPAPDRLDLGRTPNPHLAFGLATHACPGAQLARLEARAAIAALLGRFPALRRGIAPVIRRRTAVLRGLERLPVRLA